MTENAPSPKYVLLKMADRPAYLIGQLIEESRDEVVLYYPSLITVYNDENGMQVITSKYLPFAQGDLVAIVKTSIHAVATPKARLIQHHLEFLKHWRDAGMEQILEARVVGDKEPDIEQDDYLNDDPPTKHDTKH